jgi:hypothetical protein
VPKRFHRSDVHGVQRLPPRAVLQATSQREGSFDLLASATGATVKNAGVNPSVTTAYS